MESTRFAQLAIGQPFRFQEELYRKVTPLLAESLDGGKRRMIPRSAIVTTDSARPTAQREVAERPDHCLEAVEHYHQELTGWLKQELTSTIPPDRLPPLLEGVERAYQALTQRLKQHDKQDRQDDNTTQL